MSRSAVCIFAFGTYFAILGVLLVAMPNVLLSVMRISSTHEVWIQLAGIMQHWGIGWHYFEWAGITL